ncbi:hypothetical protein V8C37DRAFT_364766 [Trichoderma ceciliae]
MADIESQEVDPYSDFDLYIPLVADDADNAGFRLLNKPGGETHRVMITGYDRRKATAVRGRLYHVVHGIMGGGNRSPATLIVFEWLLVPGKLGKRFKQVDIDVTFAVHGSRPGMMPDDDLGDYTPDVITVAPDVPISSFFSGREVTKETSQSISLEIGYQGASFSPGLSNSSTEVTHRTDYRFIAGYPAFVNKAHGEPNSVHWTLQENSSQESGTPKVVRTAVLLERRAGDYGQFSANVNTSANIGMVANAVESIRKAIGSIPEDDPVIFDPKSAQKVGHGASVLFGSKHVEEYTSPCDRNNLHKESLTKFLIEDDDKRWRVGQENNKDGN